MTIERVELELRLGYWHSPAGESRNCKMESTTEAFKRNVHQRQENLNYTEWKLRFVYRLINRTFGQHNLYKNIENYWQIFNKIAWKLYTIRSVRNMRRAKSGHWLLPPRGVLRKFHWRDLWLNCLELRVSYCCYVVIYLQLSCLIKIGILRRNH